MARADLHLHTVASDGTWSPRELVDSALKAGLSMIAITDHDTTAGILEAQDRGLAVGLEVVAGVELSVQTSRGEVHLLGLDIQPEDRELQDMMRLMRMGRTGRTKLILEKLAKLGIPISYQRVCEIAGDAGLGRPHIARVMVEAGYVASVPQAFERYLAEGRPAYVPRLQVDPQLAISTIHRAGGVAVCAHPGLLNDDTILADLVKAGLDALEVYHSAHTPWQTLHFLAAATEHQLLVSGGSDCHGPGIKTSVLLGSVTITLDLARKLLEACNQYRT